LICDGVFTWQSNAASERTHPPSLQCGRQVRRMLSCRASRR
jgi:hypothetical protein